MLDMPLAGGVDYGFIKSTFFSATTNACEEFQNKWMSSDTWTNLKTKYCLTDT
jgi:hypothetical protein